MRSLEIPSVTSQISAIRTAGSGCRITNSRGKGNGNFMHPCYYNRLFTYINTCTKSYLDLSLFLTGLSESDLERRLLSRPISSSSRDVRLFLKLKIGLSMTKGGHDKWYTCNLIFIQNDSVYNDYGLFMMINKPSKLIYSTIIYVYQF